MGGTQWTLQSVLVLGLNVTERGSTYPCHARHLISGWSSRCCLSFSLQVVEVLTIMILRGEEKKDFCEPLQLRQRQTHTRHGDRHIMEIKSQVIKPSLKISGTSTFPSQPQSAAV